MVIFGITTPGLFAPLSGMLELLVNTPQTISIALGAVLIAVADYRLLLAVEAAVVAAAGAWLLTRPEQRVAAPH